MRKYTFMKIYASLVCLILLVVGCYDEEDISTVKGEIPYEVTEGNNDVDKYIYNFYKENGSIIRYDFDTIEYTWNMEKIYGDIIIKKIEIADLENKTDDEIALLDKGVSMIKKVFLDVYDTEFKKNYFPLNIFMADEVNKMVWGSLKEQNVLVGNSYIAIGGVRDGVDELTESQLLDIKKDVNGEFWMSYLIGKSRIYIPEKFYEVSKQYYGKDLKELPENKNLPKDKKVDVMQYGFWPTEPYTSVATTKDADLKDFITTIITTPYSQLKPMLDKYSLLKDKYDVLVNRLNTRYGIDLQAIGNKN